MACSLQWALLLKESQLPEMIEFHNPDACGLSMLGSISLSPLHFTLIN